MKKSSVREGEKNYFWPPKKRRLKSTCAGAAQEATDIFGHGGDSFRLRRKEKEAILTLPPATALALYEQESFSTLTTIATGN